MGEFVKKGFNCPQQSNSRRGRITRRPLMDGTNPKNGDILSVLFAREGASWSEVETTLTKILANDAHPNANSLRRLLGHTVTRCWPRGQFDRVRYGCAPPRNVLNASTESEMPTSSTDGDSLLAQLFAREGASWAEIARGVRQILDDEANPHFGDLRRVLADVGTTSNRKEILAPWVAVFGQPAEQPLPLEALNAAR